MKLDVLFILFLYFVINGVNIFAAEFGADKINYRGIFDENIYDLGDYASDTALLVNFNIKKKQKIVDYFARAIEQSEAHVTNLEENSASSKHAMQVIRTFVVSAIGLVARSAAGLAAGQIFDQSKAACQQVISQEHMKKLLSQIEEAKQAAKKLSDNIDNEIVGPLEKEFVLKRKSISIGLRREIETMLIRVRNEESNLSEKLDFIRCALDLPLTHKVLNYEDYENKFLANKRFNAFDDKLRKNLLALIRKICIDSETSDDTSTKLRTTCYFHGHPGAGKTSTAVELAEMLGLPCFAITVHGISELDRDNIQGSRGWQPRIGWFVEALMAKAPDGKRYTNGFLVLNDYDRILIQGDGSPNVAALTFLCEYLDTDLKEILSGYFKAPLGVRRLNIIVTANTPLPEDKKAYKALLSRADIMAFGGFNEEHVGKFIIGFIDECVKKYKLNPTEKARLIRYAEMKHAALRINSELDLRTIKREIENKVFHLDVFDTPMQRQEISVTKGYSDYPSLADYLWHEPAGLYLFLGFTGAYTVFYIYSLMF